MGMQGKRDTGSGPRFADLSDWADALRDATEGLDLNDLERRSKIVALLVKSRIATGAGTPVGEDMMTGNDDRLDAAGEQQLRDELLRRLVALSAELETKGDHPEPEPG